MRYKIKRWYCWLNDNDKYRQMTHSNLEKSIDIIIMRHILIFWEVDIWFRVGPYTNASCLESGSYYYFLNSASIYVADVLIYLDIRAVLPFFIKCYPMLSLFYGCTLHLSCMKVYSAGAFIRYFLICIQSGLKVEK